MGRPKEFQDLTTITVTMERDMVELAKYYNINVSQICREALREVLSKDQEIKKYQPVDKFSLLSKDTLDYWHDKVIEDKSPAMIRIRACAKVFRRITGKTFVPIEILEFYKKREKN